MIYSNFQNLKISQLGFGLMRLPLLPDGKTIDKQQLRLMIDYAIAGGVNYFDTAFPYHSGLSEVVSGEILRDYPREKWMIADKYPGHQHAAVLNPAETFELQLRKCGVDYFDFYLLHNVCENSMENYLSPRWGILDYFVEQKRLGRIRHLGFSTHADIPALEQFLDTPRKGGGTYGSFMEFCQIQLNYLDWTLQNAKEKCRILNDRNIPIWVMEPVRGGALAKLPEQSAALLKEARPGETPVSWAFRWLQGIPGVTVILSGMSDFCQMKQNVETFRESKPLNDSENALIEQVASSLHKTVPCTGCRYCCDGCPQGLEIPVLISAYNDLSLGVNFTPLMRLEALPADKMPDACLSCGACVSICPQHINVPETLAKLSELYAGMPKWSDICRKRALEAAKLKL